MTMTESSREKTMPADPAIQPFRIDIPQADLDDLKARLARARWPDQLLTNVTLYWLTGTAGSSARLYYEAGRGGDWSPPATSAAPTGVAVFPREIAPPIRRFAEQSNNIVHWAEFDRGGHFAAMEVPDLLVGDVRDFFRRFRWAARRCRPVADDDCHARRRAGNRSRRAR
jgi:hypothetical protein